MRSSSLTRRRLLQALGLGAVGAAAFPHLPSARAAVSGGARRVIFFYFPDGVPGIDQAGEKSLWDAQGSGSNLVLSDLHTSLLPFKDQCVFLNGLSMGPTDAGSHPGGAQKLLTAFDHAGGPSIDRVLAQALGVQSLYLGAMATEGLSYQAAGTAPAAPENSPLAAFNRLFPGGQANTGSGGGTTTPALPSDPDGASILDDVLADLDDLSGSWSRTEKTKLDLHLGALRDLERSVKQLPKAMTTPVENPATCDSPQLGDYDPNQLNDPANYPRILKAQTDLMVQAMACNLTRVGLLQNSVHTSELNMAAFPGTPMFKANYYLGSHKASHYGTSHAEGDELFHAYHQQVRWWVDQYAYLLQALKNRPEGEGTMLDYSLVVVCSEISDGNTHSHDNMPFILAGSGGGSIRTGQVLQFQNQPHAGLYSSIAQAMGKPMTFGQANAGPLPGLLAT